MLAKNRTVKYHNAYKQGIFIFCIEISVDDRQFQQIIRISKHKNFKETLKLRHLLVIAIA